MGNAAGSIEVPQGKEGKMVSAPPGSTSSQKQTAGMKLPMPPEEELEQRFSAVLVSCDSVQQVRAHVSSHRKERKGKRHKETKNLEYVGNVHVLWTSLSQYQVHNATVERYIRGPLCWSLLQH